MSELKPCPFCGCEEVSLSEIMPNMVLCSNIDCYFYAVYTPVMIWQSRPIEDGLRAELARLKTEYDAEVDQFNDGVAAGEKGGLDPFLDQPHYEPDYDEWRNGYYAGSYDRLTAELARRDDIISRLKEDAERLADFSGHKPFDVTPTSITVCNGFGCKCGYSDAVTLHRALMKELE